ncbi:MAG TPA: hypothetical protein VGR45_00700 [Stellaceae bacterium]|nr:hypothetical protein [Stellaceae bacterium]
MELPKIKIGGEEIVLPAIMNFATLNRCWPAIRAFDKAEDDMSQVSCALAFIAALLVKTRPEVNLAWLEERVKIQKFNPDKIYWRELHQLPDGPNGEPRHELRHFDPESSQEVTDGDPRVGLDERPAILAAVRSILTASGLVPRGEARPAKEPANPSTAISSMSSPS